jgi:hypothetical protein
LVDAITAAEDNGYENTLTLQAMIRTLHIGQALDSVLVGDNDRARKVYNFYQMSFDFIIDNVAHKLDIPVYIPFYGDNSKFDVLANEKQFAEYGKEQLQWLMDNFIYGTDEHYAKGFSVYMKIAEEVTKGVADDLSQSLFGTVYACQIEGLRTLSTEIATYNGGDTSIFGDSQVYAVNITVTRINNIIANLSHSCANRY